MADGVAIPKGLDGLVLAGYDFDKTIALTSEQLPEGHTVESAYETAVEKVFNHDALTEYRASGGLRNRAPSEIVDQLGHHLGLVRPFDAGVRRGITEDLIGAKLGCLSPQIGRKLPDGGIWPRLNDGFAQHWLGVSLQHAIRTGVASSGHDEFIRRTFEVHDQPHPDIIVSDDTMRPYMDFLPRAKCEKPSRLLLDLLTDRWLHLVLPPAAPYIEQGTFNAIVARHVIYCGDDPVKDGQMAQNADATFVHIPPTAAAEGFENMRVAIDSLRQGMVHDR